MADKAIISELALIAGRPQVRTITLFKACRSSGLCTVVCRALHSLKSRFRLHVVYGKFEGSRDAITVFVCDAIPAETRLEQMGRECAQGLLVIAMAPAPKSATTRREVAPSLTPNEFRCAVRVYRRLLGSGDAVYKELDALEEDVLNEKHGPLSFFLIPLTMRLEKYALDRLLASLLFEKGETLSAQGLVLLTIAFLDVFAPPTGRHKSVQESLAQHRALVCVVREEPSRPYHCTVHPLFARGVIRLAMRSAEASISSQSRFATVVSIVVGDVLKRDTSGFALKELLTSRWAGGQFSLLIDVFAEVDRRDLERCLESLSNAAVWAPREGGEGTPIPDSLRAHTYVLRMRLAEKRGVGTYDVERMWSFAVAAPSLGFGWANVTSRASLADAIRLNRRSDLKRDSAIADHLAGFYGERWLREAEAEDLSAWDRQLRVNTVFDVVLPIFSALSEGDKYAVRLARRPNMFARRVESLIQRHNVRGLQAAREAMARWGEIASRDAQSSASSNSIAAERDTIVEWLRSAQSALANPAKAQTFSSWGK